MQHQQYEVIQDHNLWNGIYTVNFYQCQFASMKNANFIMKNSSWQLKYDRLGELSDGDS
jgi:hypothetical protein